MKKEAQREDNLNAAYFGPLHSTADFYKTWLETSMIPDLQGDWNFFHMDDVDCAKELGVNYPGISLFRPYDNDYL